MATVRSVTVRIARRKMDGALYNPRNRWSEKVMLFAFVEDDEGRLGVGETWLMEGGAGAVKAVIEEDMAPLVIGRRSFEVRALTETLIDKKIIEANGGEVVATEFFPLDGLGYQSEGQRDCAKTFHNFG